MSVLGNYEVHKSDNDCNPNIVNAIALAKVTKSPRDYIDCISGGKSIIDVRNNKDTSRIEIRKQNVIESREEAER